MIEKLRRLATKLGELLDGDGEADETCLLCGRAAETDLCETCSTPAGLATHEALTERR